ncbi:hypothetical protein [Flavobacterium silvaticum]|uniref:Uncharacterized protein n=1 Tax=Flavobacterium silvaticum TaxID=1852020 RepID=A0A972JK97_9FLAO|nr:hypothetical protein [Flavobacterium silvaticum]NMH28917.1 hypothetical protein [Flavobacterium silvaticum]
MKTLTLLLTAIAFSTLQISAQPYVTNEQTKTDLASVASENELINVRYFYYPNLQAYFDRTTSTYLYTRNGQDWIESSNLPNGLRGYSMSNGKRVPITDYDGDEPYEKLEAHKKAFPANYSTKKPLPTKESDNKILASN